MKLRQYVVAACAGNEAEGEYPPPLWLAVCAFPFASLFFAALVVCFAVLSVRSDDDVTRMFCKRWTKDRARLAAGAGAGREGP